MPDRGQYRGESWDINPKASLSRINAQDCQPPTSLLQFTKSVTHYLETPLGSNTYVVQKILLLVDCQLVCTTELFSKMSKVHEEIKVLYYSVLIHYFNSSFDLSCNNK